MFPGTISGQVRLLGLTMKEIGFCLGFPLLIVCLLGLGLALRQRSRNFNLLAMSLFGLSYYVFYIAVIGYNYDRFNLPVCVLLAFFGGKALSDLMALRPPWPTVAKAAAGLALVYSFSLAASVDILMVKDSRYHIEGWLQANVPSGTRVGFVGLPNYLPRLDGYARRPISPDLGEFERSALPEYVVLNVNHASRFPADSEEGRFFRGFPEAGPGYSLVYRYQAPLGRLPLRPSPAFSSLAQLNPEIEVYIKGDVPRGDTLREPAGRRAP